MLTPASHVRPAPHAQRWYTLASWLVILLGLLHNAVFVSGSMLNVVRRQSSPVYQSMKEYKIDLIGTHSLLKFYDGFSLTMGCLLILLGTLNLLVSRSLPLPALRAAALFNAVACLLLTALSLVYFHLLATSFFVLALAGYALCYVRSQRLPS
ncbi:LIC_13387 family protein [Paenibacillus sp. S-38]|uniref:LIC_13387 family protein n=1 Tax=Paenibacillus sp. S-38 TaxID=3416710 RepID=UPI003CFA5FB4